MASVARDHRGTYLARGRRAPFELVVCQGTASAMWRIPLPPPNIYLYQVRTRCLREFIYFTSDDSDPVCSPLRLALAA